MRKFTKYPVTKQPVNSAKDATYKTDRRLSPTSERYRDYLIVLDRNGYGYNIYDKHRELEDHGYPSMEAAKKAVDEIIGAAEDRFLDDYDEWGKVVGRPPKKQYQLVTEYKGVKILRQVSGGDPEPSSPHVKTYITAYPDGKQFGFAFDSLEEAKQAIDAYESEGRYVFSSNCIESASSTAFTKQFTKHPKKVTSSQDSDTYWMAKYTSVDGKQHKILFSFSAADFDEAEEEMDAVIPEPYTKACLLGRAPSKYLAERDGFVVVGCDRSATVTSSEDMDDYEDDIREISQEFTYL